jgi:hypothetical protein
MHCRTWIGRRSRSEAILRKRRRSRTCRLGFHDRIMRWTSGAWRRGRGPGQRIVAHCRAAAAGKWCEWHQPVRRRFQRRGTAPLSMSAAAFSRRSAGPWQRGIGRIPVTSGCRSSDVPDARRQLAHYSVATISASPLSRSFRLCRCRGDSVSTTSSVGLTCASRRCPPIAMPSARLTTT